ncbi:dynamin family protein [bacterium]|nr:dynamin family protein [bacterium]
MSRAASTPCAPSDAAVRELGGRLAWLLARARLPALAAEARAEVARLRRPTLVAAVVGEFKRGKSSLINALVGQDLLPVGALPLTTVGTRLTHGDVLAVTVALRDGRRLVVDPAALADYVTERGNPGNRRRVSEVTVAAPAAVLRHGVDLVDTPGTGSAFADVGAIARDSLAAAHVLIVVLSAEQPASRREVEFVREALAAGRRTIIVENKIDLVSDDERGPVIDFTRAQLCRLRHQGALPVLAVSAAAARRAARAGDGAALEASGVPALAALLAELVRGEGQAIVTAAARRRLAGIAARAVATQQMRARSAPLTALWDEERRAHGRQQLGLVLLRELLETRERAAEAARTLLRTCAGPTTAAVEQRLRDCIRRFPVRSGARSVRAWAVAFEGALRQELASALSCWHAGEHECLQAAAAALVAQWRQQAIDAAASIRGLPPLAAPHLDLAAPTLDIPPIGLARTLLLPGAVGRRHLRRRAERWVAANVPALLAARRAALGRDLARTLEEAASAWRRSLAAALDPCAADAAPTVAAPASPIDVELAVLHDQLHRDSDAG